MSFQVFRSLFQTLGRPENRPPETVPASPPEGPPLADPRQETLARLIHLPVRDVALYERAMTHRSVVRGSADSHLVSNERLEFLGDAVLGFVVAEDLHLRFADQDEGFLTRLRAKLVNGQALALAAQSIGLGPHIRLSDNMEQTGGRSNQTILADALEATIGAVYLDLGMDAARTFIRRTMLERVDLFDLAERRDNYKSVLLEFAQARGWSQPVYRVASEEGPSHEKTFTIEVVIEGVPRGEGVAGSKKQAEQQAARQALAYLQEQKAGSAETDDVEKP